jgi:hypothetical protein
MLQSIVVAHFLCSAEVASSCDFKFLMVLPIYLTTNTRPDIGFAVSQVAQYSKAPKQSHDTAVKTTIRYLKRTRDKGMIVVCLPENWT